ncbi:hypothetical protein FZI85_21530 [Mycobacterium sp. CBMA293]|nr:hypothetical protein [Mycolicibacterium sp. CBMA 360]MUL61381.1 hypothetical protein [Mycolicibacterium sp. CBMA 335]MUL72116.1 hypothetical protein [Mycolicibacterium sp. CBMA 311]MUL96283.1 hypothetical protein [Mycolicibacterium sp. CBMA 230]MUM13593.1 hypothetical protein [Mycolicibacterium sp. CBMA 293]MUM30822.1 hypothetical protein [Mycolicibacterium sp. CBMA 361]
MSIGTATGAAAIGAAIGMGAPSGSPAGTGGTTGGTTAGTGGTTAGTTGGTAAGTTGPTIPEDAMAGAPHGVPAAAAATGAPPAAGATAAPASQLYPPVFRGTAYAVGLNATTVAHTPVLATIFTAIRPKLIITGVSLNVPLNYSAENLRS